MHALNCTVIEKINSVGYYTIVDCCWWYLQSAELINTYQLLIRTEETQARQ